MTNLPQPTRDGNRSAAISRRDAPGRRPGADACRSPALFIHLWYRPCPCLPCPGPGSAARTYPCLDLASRGPGLTAVAGAAAAVPAAGAAAAVPAAGAAAAVPAAGAAAAVPAAGAAADAAAALASPAA